MNRTIAIAIAIAIATSLLTLLAFSQTANARTCTYSINAKGLTYVSKNTAKASARNRWQIKVATRLGNSFANYAKAKNRQYTCTSGLRNGHTVYRCRAIGIPCRKSLPFGLSQ